MNNLLGRLIVGALGVVVTSSTLMGAEPEATGKVAGPDAPAVWLGNPDVDPVAARVRDGQRRAGILRWQAANDLAAYERVGKKDPRWDDEVRACLRLLAEAQENDEEEAKGVRAGAKDACERAVKAGCDDPFVRYLALRLELSPPGLRPDELARLYAGAERDVAASEYPPIHKFTVATRTAIQILSRRHGADGKIGHTFVGYTIPAVYWPPGTHIQTVLQHGLAQLKLLLHDPTVPAPLYHDLMNIFLRGASTDPIGRAEVLVPLAQFYETDEIKDQRTYDAKICLGSFWEHYAWDARGNGFANTVSPDGWQRFGERLSNSAEAYRTAWQIDPTGFEAPLNMIDISMSADGPENENPEVWFRRAMDARPDSFRAASNRLMCLEPKWGGSVEEMLAFGRQCFATQDWTSRLPFILLEAHNTLAASVSGGPAAYWKRPAVWADIKQVYHDALAVHPKRDFDRTYYALDACRAGDWQTAKEQFDRLGDHPDEGPLRHRQLSRRKYDDLRREAAERVSQAGQLP